MLSTLTWIDHDAAARERSLRLLALFQEKESRDELGLGGIRDAFADRLFPGTSTIQTRLRYMLFVPWVYQQLEAQKVPAREFVTRARRLELELVRPLLDSDDQAGVFGRMAGNALKRLPSSVYWAGLGTWGIRCIDASQDQYHRGIDAVYARRARQHDHDDGEAEPEFTWHPRLPKPPEGFPNRLDFTLTQEEASFLRDRIATTDSLLAHLALYCAPATVDFPWEHKDYADFPALYQELLSHARLFSEVMHGATLVYNLALADLAGKNDLSAAYRERLAVWAAGLDGIDLRGWSLPRLWELTLNQGHTITPATRRFVENWVALAREKSVSIPDDMMARTLVQSRERALKGIRSRFTNSRARDQWSGAAGLGRLSFRWPTVRSFLHDLSPGLQES